MKGIQTSEGHLPTKEHRQMNKLEHQKNPSKGHLLPREHRQTDKQQVKALKESM
jgi:hypothetical protein